MCRIADRESTQRKLQEMKKQAEDLEYALRVLIETGTIIPQELDEAISEAIDGPNLYSVEDVLVSDFLVC